MITWVMVANRQGARIFVRNERKLGLVGEFDQAAGKRGSAGEDAPRPHHTPDRHGHGHEAAASAHEHSAEVFAKELAGELKSGRAQQHVTQIILIAEPHFLGILRHELDAPTARLVTSSVPKDLVHATIDDIEAHVNTAVPV
jgi:protein required for attachment to host cells